MGFIEGSRRQTVVSSVEDLAAGADLADRAVFAAPESGAVITRVGIVPLAASAGVDASNPVTITLKDADGNAIATATFSGNPAARSYADLGAPAAAHAVLARGEVARLDVTQGPAADLPALLLVVEYVPAAA